jgi:hypothetical protein
MAPSEEILESVFRQRSAIDPPFNWPWKAFFAREELSIRPSTGGLSISRRASGLVMIAATGLLNTCFQARYLISDLAIR